MDRAFDRPLPLPLERFQSYLEVIARLRLGPRLRRKLSSSDLVQETFLEACRAAPRFRGTSPHEQAAWLRRILLDRIANHHRRWRYLKRDIERERSLEAGLEESASRLERWLASEQISPSGRVSQEEDFLGLTAALASLDGDLQDALLLRFCDGLSLDAIGDLLDVSRHTVARRLREGLTLLRRALAEP